MPGQTLLLRFRSPTVSCMLQLAWYPDSQRQSSIYALTWLLSTAGRRGPPIAPIGPQRIVPIRRRPEQPAQPDRGRPADGERHAPAGEPLVFIASSCRLKPHAGMHCMMSKLQRPSVSGFDSMVCWPGCRKRLWKTSRPFDPRGTLRWRRPQTSGRGWLTCSRQPASRPQRAASSQRLRRPRPRTLRCRRAVAALRDSPVASLNICRMSQARMTRPCIYSVVATYLLTQRHIAFAPSCTAV